MIIGIGCDIVECLRIAQMIERHGEDFLRRVYTDDEIAYCSSRSQATQEYAGRWAAKEAIQQAIEVNASQVVWRDIEIRQEPGGRPRVALAGEPRARCVELGVGELKLAISHCRTHATAYAIALEAYDE
ncbi:MAG: holo-ACP synthase [Pirellulaceae bacterium]|jgi:holo-[acyl-carrier protein] synthase|nr:holo-ACP synthase [Pirellulaceae bacterium]